MGKPCDGDLGSQKDDGGLWKCNGGNDTSQCIDITKVLKNRASYVMFKSVKVLSISLKVCDGQSGFSLNNCEGGEDEDEEFCRNAW